MASLAKHFSLLISLLLISLLISSHARELTYFGKSTRANPKAEEEKVTTHKTPATNAAEQQQLQEQRSFLPENDKGYGLYGTTLSPYVTTTADNSPPDNNYQPYDKTWKNKEPVRGTNQPPPLASEWRPWNYAGDSYVTMEKPKNFDDETTRTDNRNSKQKYPFNFNQKPNQQEEDEEEENTGHTGYNKYYSNEDASTKQFNDKTKYANYDGSANEENNYAKYENANTLTNEETKYPYSYNPQSNTYSKHASNEAFGMSDTRKVENGRYFYNTQSNSYAEGHPYNFAYTTSSEKDQSQTYEPNPFFDTRAYYNPIDSREENGDIP